MRLHACVQQLVMAEATLPCSTARGHARQAVSQLFCTAQRACLAATSMRMVGGCQRVAPSHPGVAAQDLQKQLNEGNVTRDKVRTQLVRLQERRDADAARLRAACDIASAVRFSPAHWPPLAGRWCHPVA